MTKAKVYTADEEPAKSATKKNSFASDIGAASGSLLQGVFHKTAEVASAGTSIVSKAAHKAADLGTKSHNVTKAVAQGDLASALSALKAAEEEPSAPTVYHRYCSIERYPGEWMDMDYLIVHPNSSFVTVWNVIMTLFILFCVLWIPFEMSFNFDSSKMEQRSPFIIFIDGVQLAMDVYFLVDMFVQFRIALLVDGELDQNPWHIAKNYLLGWFTPDFVSTMGSLMSRVLAQYSGLSLLRNVKVIRLIRLLKLLRMAKLKKVLDSISEGVGPEMAVIAKLGKLMLITLCITHFCGCIFVSLAGSSCEPSCLSDGEGEDRHWCVDGETNVTAFPSLELGEEGACAPNWIQSYHSDKTGEDTAFPNVNDYIRHNAATVYLTSLYWAFITVTTVGYGDILPNNDEEMTFCLVTAFVGTGIFAFINGEITALASQKHAAAAAYMQKKDSVNDFMNYYNLPKALRIKIRSFYQDGYDNGLFLDTDTVVSELPLNLRGEVRDFLKKDLIHQVDIFRHAPEAVCAYLVNEFQSMEYDVEDFIFRSGTDCDEIVMLDHGTVELQIYKNGIPGEILLVGPGTSFGMHHRDTSAIDALRTGEAGDGSDRWEYTSTATAVQHCEVFKISREVVEELTRLWPEFEGIMDHASGQLHRITRRVALNEADIDNNDGDGGQSGGSGSGVAEEETQIQQKNGDTPSTPTKAAVGAAAGGAGGAGGRAVASFLAATKKASTAAGVTSSLPLSLPNSNSGDDQSRMLSPAKVTMAKAAAKARRQAARDRLANNGGHPTDLHSNAKGRWVSLLGAMNSADDADPKSPTKGGRSAAGGGGVSSVEQVRAVNARMDRLETTLGTVQDRFESMEKMLTNFKGEIVAAIQQSQAVGAVGAGAGAVGAGDLAVTPMSPMN